MNTRRIILLLLLAMVLAVGGYSLYSWINAPSQSPKTTSTYNNNGLSMSIVYCQPSKKGRLIFGTAADGALQPYGEYWRLGANAATQITINKDVMFGGKELSAGEYVVYAVPGESTWTIGLNSELERWGAFEVDHALDIMQVEVPVSSSSKEYEQFTIEFSDAEAGVVHMNLLWDTTKIPVPIAMK